ncbi:MAG: hypothetical protein NTW29_08680 [Bacteroidetes bacterium]|nr:hypothetical protein [Bacteroidota bacterium]
MRCAPLLYLLFASSISYAQTGTKDREPSNKKMVIPLADSIWNRLTVREKVNYCLKTGERDIQLCGRWGGGYIQNTRNYIFENTGQYYFLGEYTYSKRQLDVFRKYPDTIAWMLREDLFEKKNDLFYWHNIISRMPASEMVADALMDYYEEKKALESAPLTLLMGWMERDSFPAYLQSDIYKKLEDLGVIKVPHSVKNKEKIRTLIKNYIHRLPFENDPYTATTKLLYDSLKRADNQLRTTSRLSDSVFNRLNARELLMYCERYPEKYNQICGFTQDFGTKIFLLPDKYITEQPGNFSDRQITALKVKRDSVAWYLLNGYRDKMIYGRNPAYSLVLLLHTWQIVPDILKSDSLKLFNRYFYMSVLCQFMLINSYPPFLTFWKKNAVENSYVIRTRKNEEIILQLAADYYQWKMEGKDQ